MPIKVSVNLNLKKYPGLIKRQFAMIAENDRTIIEAIVDLIQKGISPVFGLGRFQEYSDSYKEQMKRPKSEPGKLGKKQRPVNLTLTGTMIKAFQMTRNGDRVFIENTDDKAVYHNKKGAGRSRTLRRFLPTNKGELFSRVVTFKIRDILDQATRQLLRR